ncbi:unnamed protein product [Meganyctiphanes norvegica]|uniref:protein-serine/threonine phosphatase n=1 Tax=Meganyctiphanes norvegica TaxID=48144 RepID=A0AAV2Q973_MEGNR
MHYARVRYLCVIERMGRQDTEEACLLGIDFTSEVPTLGLVVSVLADTNISLDGDGGFNVSTAGRHHIFKPISVQAMWSALQSLHKCSSKAQDHHYFLGGLNHDWVGYYERGVNSDQSCINEWNTMDSLESKRPASPDSLTDKEGIQVLIRSKLKEIMMSVDIDEVNSKYIRQRLEEELKMDLFKFKSYIDQEMLTILGQMDEATEVFPHVYLGSEWNASNIDELQGNRVGFILNVTKEIDNFFPGTFDYLNIRVYDDEATELLKHWDRTFKYIAHAKEKGLNVLVHCKMGISRSASVVIAYAMKEFNMKLEDALELVKKKRNCINPNSSFCQQLKTYEGILDASRQRHNALWRSKSESNLKSASASRNRSPQLNMDDPDNFDGTMESLLQRQSQENIEIREPLGVHNTDHIQRPKSWSPDEHTAETLFSEDKENSGEFGESWRRSQSLNVQTWRSHVTVQQRDIRDLMIQGSIPIPNGEALSSQEVIQAVNPLYDQSPDGSTITDASSVQLSSSVKDRINEFEGGQNVNQTGLKKSPGTSAKKVEGLDSLQLQDATTSCSDEFSAGSSSTAELDKVIETLLTPTEEPCSEPVISQTKVIQKHQAVLVPSQIWQHNDAIDSEVSDTVMQQEQPSDTTVIVPKDSITLPAGIVKRQKQDFEDKVKLKECKSSVKTKDSDSCLTRQESSGSLSGQGKVLDNKQQLNVTQDSNESVIIKKDDPFSYKLDKVFDREERKQQRLSAINPNLLETRESVVSRNSSFGSVDSAVVLADRDLPSRQSSWGSGDTQSTYGTLPSRNSSFGPSDLKRNSSFSTSSDFKNETLRERWEQDKNFQITDTYFAKDTSLHSPGTIKRNRYRSMESREGETENMDDGISADCSRTSIDKVEAFYTESGANRLDNKNSTRHQHYPIQNSSSEPGIIPSLMTRSSPNISTVSPLSTPEMEVVREGWSGRERESWSGSSTQCSPLSETEVPLPGTVKQQKQILEGRTSDTTTTNTTNTAVVLKSSEERLQFPPAFSRSKSYCDNDLDKDQTRHRSPLGRSFSEKRAKFEGEKEGIGVVKKITRALEQQSTQDKGKRFRLRGVRKRSHSLERLSTSPTSPGCNPRQLLDQLLTQTQAEAQDLQEDDPAEDICVKSLVGKFEDGSDKIQQETSRTNSNSSSSSNGSTKIISRNVRAKSDSSSDTSKVLPPVPQRKSSLDYNFKPPLRAQSQPPIGMNRIQSTGVSNISINSSNSSSSSSCSSASPLTPPVTVGPNGNNQKPPVGGRGQPGPTTEVRHKKQQGKTHPLSKLQATSKANRENYHTM